jgi:hypothetical protein
MRLPWAAGNVAERADIRAVFVLTSGNFIAIAVLRLFVNRR